MTALIVMDFIEINGATLDYKQYIKDVAALRFELIYELNEALSKYGFAVSSRKLKDMGFEIIFEHRRLGLQCQVYLRKRR